MSNLIECIDCGNQVSNRAEACPNCGGPIDFETIEVETKAEPPLTEFEKSQLEKPKKSYVKIEQTYLNQIMWGKRKSAGIRKVKKKDPNRNLIIVIIIIAVVAFGIFFNSESGQKMFNAEYKDCLKYLSKSWCAIHLQ